MLQMAVSRKTGSAVSVRKTKLQGGVLTAIDPNIDLLDPLSGLRPALL